MEDATGKGNEISTVNHQPRKERMTMSETTTTATPDQELFAVQPEEPRDLGLALSLQINRCHRLLCEKKEALRQADDEGLALFGELGLTSLENELRKAGIALLWEQREEMRKSLAALKEVK
jgi:hypothetical protein